MSRPSQTQRWMNPKLEVGSSTVDHLAITDQLVDINMQATISAKGSHGVKVTGEGELLRQMDHSGNCQTAEESVGQLA